MLPNTDCYGTRGLQASSGERLVALVGRSTDGLYKAMAAFDTTLARIKSGGFVPWTAPAGEMTLLHAQWIASLTWQWATALTDAAVVSGDSGGDIDPAAYSVAVKYCADAADQSVKALTMANALVRGGKRPGNAALEPPSLHLSAALVELAWTQLESTFARVCADLAWIRRLGIPARFEQPHTALETAFRSQADVFGYHQDQWRVSRDVASRRQILQDAMRLLPELFKLGQQVWAPYLLGRVFVEVLRSSAVFDKYKFDFDPWALADPAEATKRATDQQSCITLAEFWKTVADPRSVVALQNLINDAVALQKAERLPGKSYQIAPWHGQFRATEALTLGVLSCPAGSIFAINFRGAAGQRTAEIRVTGSS